MLIFDKLTSSSISMLKLMLARSAILNAFPFTPHKIIGLYRKVFNSLSWSHFPLLLKQTRGYLHSKINSLMAIRKLNTYKNKLRKAKVVFLFCFDFFLRRMFQLGVYDCEYLHTCADLSLQKMNLQYSIISLTLWFDLFYILLTWLYFNL